MVARLLGEQVSSGYVGSIPTSGVYGTTSSIIHLSPDCVRFFGKDVLEIPEENFELPDFFKILELNSNLIIGNLYIYVLRYRTSFLKRILNYSDFFNLLNMKKALRMLQSDKLFLIINFL